MRNLTHEKAFELFLHSGNIDSDIDIDTTQHQTIISIDAAILWEIEHRIIFFQELLTNGTLLKFAIGMAIAFWVER